MQHPFVLVCVQQMMLCFSAPIELSRASSNLCQTAAGGKFHATHAWHVTVALQHPAAFFARLQRNKLHLRLHLSGYLHANDYVQCS